MKSLSGAAARAAIACAVLVVATGAAAMAPSRKEQASYLACYRKVLKAPEFAALDPAGLYAIRDSRLAEAVIERCRREIRPYREDVLGIAQGAQARAVAKGHSQLPAGMLAGIADMGLRLRIGNDLAEADPRVKPIAAADRDEP